MERLQAQGAAVGHVRELVGMARTPRHGGSVLVELKAVPGAYPLYGRLETRPAQPLGALLADGGIVVEEALPARLGVRQGHALEIGAARLTIRGVVLREPDRAGGPFTLGPRVLLNPETLDRTGLVQPGSRVRYRTLLRLPDSLSAREARERIARELADPALRVAAWDEAQPGLRRFLDRMTTWLGLVGIVSLLVGASGVASAVHAFLRRALLTVAILKCVGATSGQLLGALLLQAQALGLLESIAGAALGLGAQPLVAHLAAGLVPLAIDARPDPWTVVRGVAMGVVTTLLVALWPLLAVRAIPHWLALRHEVESLPARRPWAAIAPIVAGLGALVVWQAGSLAVGGIFVGASAAALLLLAGVARAPVALSRRLPRLPSLAWRQGLATLQRPGGHAQGVIVALGAGVMLLLVAVGLLQAGLARQIDHERRREAPSFFFVDIQPAQREAYVTAVSRAAGGVVPRLTPIIRARLVAADGDAVTRELIERRRQGPDDRGLYFTHDYALTATADLPPGNEVLRGGWWAAASSSAPVRVSVEEAAGRHLGIDVGSRLAFDVQGVAIEAEVASVRRVDWQRLTTNFFMILSPGALGGVFATVALAGAGSAPWGGRSRTRSRRPSPTSRRFPSATSSSASAPSWARSRWRCGPSRW